MNSSPNPTFSLSSDSVDPASIPKHTLRNYLGNIQSLLSPPLSQDDMDELSTINKDRVLIKGHVFLWPAAKDWRDLWDLDGEIVTG